MKIASRIVFMVTFACIIAFAGMIEADDMQVRQPTAAEMGKSVHCPVTRSPFEISELTPVIDYKGKSYYFCCAGCIDEFKKDPEKYAAGGEFTLRQPSKDEIGRTRQCPVNKAEFPVTPETPVLDYKGKSYFFCCSSCVDQFKQTPEEFEK
jgi:YHS domain-containing protein